MDRSKVPVRRISGDVLSEEGQQKQQRKNQRNKQGKQKKNVQNCSYSSQSRKEPPNDSPLGTPLLVKYR